MIAFASVEDTLRQLIEESSGIPARLVCDDSTLSGDLAMDSLALVSFQTALDEAFRIYCELDKLLELDRFEHLSRFVFEQLQGSENGPDGRPPRLPESDSDG